jgi:hypothetical protein
MHKRKPHLGVSPSDGVLYFQTKILTRVIFRNLSIPPSLLTEPVDHFHTNFLLYFDTPADHFPHFLPAVQGLHDDLPILA